MKAVKNLFCKNFKIKSKVVEKGCIRNKWVKQKIVLKAVKYIFTITTNPIPYFLYKPSRNGCIKQNLKALQQKSTE